MDSRKNGLQTLIALIKANEDWLIERILAYAGNNGYLPCTSQLKEAWRHSIARLSDSLAQALTSLASLSPINANKEQPLNDPLVQFGTIEAHRHRKRGLDLFLFMGLFKYYRQSYLDLLQKNIKDISCREEWQKIITLCFDKIEISFCTSWSEISDLESKSRYQSIFNATQEAMFIHDAQSGQVLEVNNRSMELYQATLEDFQTLGPDKFSLGESPFSSKEAHEWIKKAVSQGPQQFEWLARTKNGDLFWTEVSLNRANIGGQPRIIAAVRDISKRKEIEQALALSRNMFKKVLDNIPVRVFWKDKNSIYLGCNRKFAEDAGLPHPKDIIGKTDFDLPWGDKEAKSYRQDDQKVINSSQPKIGFIESQTTARGDQIWLRTSKIPLRDKQGKIIGVLGCYEDITQQKRADLEKMELERQVLHIQKLESLGILAGGIAHDFNNMLTGILGNTELALMQLRDDQHLKKFLKAIRISAQRAAEVCKQMLAYSGKGQFSIEPVNINLLCQEMVEIVRHSISKNIDVRFDLLDALPMVNGDRGQLGQVVMNLLINGAEAIGEQAGVLKISTKTMYCDLACLKEISFDQTLQPGEYCLLEIADTGCGMDRKTISKIFDPFFSTKFTGRGLGLSAVQGIVRGHNGGIKVYSEPGRGTSVKVLLPALQQDQERAENQMGDQRNKANYSGLILLVDDEYMVRETGRDLLHFLGFSVITAKDGQEAIDIFQSNQKEIDLIIMDLTMPCLDGLEAAKKIKDLHPGAKIILSSGFNAKNLQEHSKKGYFDHFLQKPYEINRLRLALKKLLAHSNGKKD